MSKIPKEYRLSKKLDAEIKRYYKDEIGVPDLTQNWLELFSDDVIEDLFTIMHSCSDNQQKSDYVTELLEPRGFTERGGGLGTNIVVLTNPIYPGVVFKIALDENGIADNFNDCVLQSEIPNYARVYARHPSSLVTVQERYFVMRPEWMNFYREDILDCLRKLSKKYLIADLTPSMLLNYGIDRQNRFVFIDGSDLYPLKQIKAKDRLRCKAVVGSDKNGNLKRCRGQCVYNDDFSQMVCEKCGHTYIPIELRPSREEEPNMGRSIYNDGFTFDEREELNRRAREAIRTGKPMEEYIPERLQEKEEEDEVPEGFHVEYFKKKKRTYKIAVQDGFHVVAVKDDKPILEKNAPKKENKKTKTHTAVNYNLKKKDKEVKHEDTTVIVPQNPVSEPVKHIPHPSDNFKDRIRYYSEHNPEEFHGYVKELIELIGWDVIDTFRESDTDAFAIMKNLLNDKDEHLEEVAIDYQAALDEITNLNSKIKYLEDTLSKIKAESAYYYEESMRLEESNKKLRDRVAELEDELYHKTDNAVIVNESDNSIIHKMQTDTRQDCIHYQVVENSDTENSELPGIYCHVRGDVVKAWEDGGLPVFVVVEGHAATILALTSEEIRESIYDAYDECLEDSNPEPVIENNEGDEEASEADAETLQRLVAAANTEQRAQEAIDIVKDFTNYLDEDDDDDELMEEEENELVHRVMDNPNPNYDPRYDMADDMSF